MASTAARLIHSYRKEQRLARENLQSQTMQIRETQYQDQDLEDVKLAKNLDQTALRQCECHIDHKKQYYTRNTDGIIYRENRHRHGINSRPYNSLLQQMDLRLKPNFAIEKTRKMVEYYRKDEGAQARRQIPLRSMVPLDSLQRINLQANHTTEAPILDFPKDRPSSAAPFKGQKQARLHQTGELRILTDDWYKSESPVETKQPEPVEVRSSNSGSRQPMGMPGPAQQPEASEPESRANGDIHQKEHLPRLLGILTSCGGPGGRPDWRRPADEKEREASFDRMRKVLQENISTTNELGAVLGIYIDMEKVEQDNIRDKLKKLMQEQAQVESKIASSSGASVRSPKSEMVSKRSLPVQSSRRALERQQQEQEQKRKEDQRRMQLATADQKLHQLKDIYIDMKRNSDLDYENFLRPDVIQQCIDDKYTVSEFVETRCKAKRHRQTYARAVTSRFERLQLGRKSEGPPANAACQAWRRDLRQVDEGSMLNRGFQDNYKIDSNQFVAATRDYLPADRAKAVFDRMLFDKSGVVSHTNVQKALATYGPQLSEQSIRNIQEKSLKQYNLKMTAKEPKLRTRLRTHRSKQDLKMTRGRDGWQTSTPNLLQDTQDSQGIQQPIKLSRKLRSKMYGMY